MDCPLDLTWCNKRLTPSSPLPWRPIRRLDTLARAPAMRKKAVVRPMYNNHVEAEQDLITCGDCQREFVLSDIAKFVQHKVNRCMCGKEKCLPFPDAPGDSFDGGDDAVATSAKINRIKSSISAPIALKESGDTKERVLPPASPQSCSLPGDLQEASLPPLEKAKDRGTIVDEDDCDATITKPSTVDDRRQVVETRDMGVNTSSSDASNPHEPVNFVCHTCKSIYKTAWFLVQHVQKAHGMKVYSEYAVDSDSDTQLKSSLSRHSIPNLLEKSSKSDKSTDSGHDHGRTHSQTSSSSSSNTSSLSSSGRSSGFQRSPGGHSPAGGASDIFMQPPPSFPFSRGQPGVPPVVTSAAFPLAPFPRPPLSNEMAMVTPENLGDLPFRRMGHFPPLPPGLEHSLPGFPFRPTGIESSVLDFYSQRLKSLAKHPQGSPAHSPSPARNHRSFQSGLSPDFGSPNPASNAQGMPANVADKTLSAHKTSCEFCGKSFRFQSNLLVHRRTHTGEKPYRCLLCPHSCAQATKLKRHMRIHIKSQLAGTGLQFPDNEGTKSKLGDDQYVDDEESDEDFDEMDEEEAAAREAAAEAELLHFTEQVRQHQKQMERQQDQGKDDNTAVKEKIADADVKKEPEETGASQTKVGNHIHKNSESKATDADDEDDEDKDSHGLSKEQKLAVLNEVMENSGLSNIQQFQDAYKQVVALSNKKAANEDNDVEENEVREGTPVYPRAGSTSSLASSNSNDLSEESSPTSQIMENGSNRSEPSTPTGKKGHDNSSPEPSAKKLKTDQISNSGQAYPPFESLYPPRETALYPGIWFPPPSSHRELFASAYRGENMLPPHPQENGLVGRPSALKMHHSGSPKSMPSLQVVSPPNTSSGSPSSIPGVHRRRNDTCEFCGKVFKNCSNLTVHRRSHTGEKPYKCALCSYACAQSSKLTRHMRTHGRLGKDVYRCKFCNMPFSVASTLEKHMRKCVEHQPGRNMSMSDRSLEIGERSADMSFSDSRLLGLSDRSAHELGHPASASSTPPSIGSVSPAVSASAL